MICNTKYIGGSRGLVVKLLDSKFDGCEFKTHPGHGSFSKLRQLGKCPVQESQYNCTLSCFALQKPGLSTGHISLHGFLRRNAWGMTLPFFLPVLYRTTLLLL